MTVRFQNWAASLGVLFILLGVPFPPSGGCEGIGVHGVEPGNWWITAFYVVGVQYKRTVPGGIETCTMGLGWYLWVPLGFVLLVYGLWRRKVPSQRARQQRD